MAGLLSTDEALSYWDDRHRRETDLRSGGHIGWDEGANEAFYLRRSASLLSLIGDRFGPDDPVFALDAGCGKGAFSRALARCGVVVEGIDASPAAIEICRASGPGRFSVATLAGYRSPFLFDVVYSIDVLFHILDDVEWEASLVNLASLVRLAGTLVTADEADGPRRRAGNYIVHRPASEYEAVLAPRGLVFRSFRSYDFRENKVGLLEFVRAN